MTPRYFQGTTITGMVKESVARNFKEVVDSFRVCPTLGITHAGFLALDKKERNNAKQVPFYVPAVFRESPSKRTYEQATHCNLLFIDIDEQKDGCCPAAPFVTNPDSLYSALEDYNFIAHTTASSTSSKPRMRIVVDAHDIPLASYPLAVQSIGKLLGLAHITTESRVAVQAMYLPTMFSDSEDFEHPLIAFRMDGRTFKVSNIVDTFSEYAEPKHANGKLPHPDTSLDALNFLRAPVPEITLGVAKEALFHVDPDCSYFDWLECAAALRHQFSPHKAEEAYDLFDEWSAKGGKYASHDDTRAKWDSLRPTPAGRAPVTIRSLLRQAVQSGWDDKRVRENCFNKLVQWFEEVETITELMENGVQKILATPLLSAVQEDVLVHQLCGIAKKRFAYTISSTAIRKDLTRTKAEIKAQEQAAVKLPEPTWARGVCYVAATQDFYRHRTGERYKKESFNAIYSRKLLHTEKTLEAAGIPITPAALSQPFVLPSDYALNHLKISTVYDYAYDPSQPTAVFFKKNLKDYINIYSPTYPELDPKGANEAGTLFQKHLGHLIAEEAYRRTLTDFMAFMVQFPGIKIRWAVLIQSVEGAGKSYLGEVMAVVLGPEHVKVINASAIKSGYNEWSFGSQLVVLDEIKVAGTNRHEIMNTLKPLITNSEIAITEKFRNTRQAENISNYMLFSNHHDALAITPGDRRYFVLKSPLQSKAQVKALGENYFLPLYALLRENPGALRAYLDDWEVSPSFQPNGHAPGTRYATDMANDSASDLTAAIRRLLIEGDYPLIQYDIVSSKMLIDVLQNEDGLRVSGQQIAQILREEGFHSIERHLLGTERHYLWVRREIDGQRAPGIAADRLKRGLKNLCMELIF